MSQIDKLHDLDISYQSYNSYALYFQFILVDENLTQIILKHPEAILVALEDVLTEMSEEIAKKLKAKFKIK